MTTESVIVDHHSLIVVALWSGPTIAALGGRCKRLRSAATHTTDPTSDKRRRLFRAQVLGIESDAGSLVRAHTRCDSMCVRIRFSLARAAQDALSACDLLADEGTVQGRPVGIVSYSPARSPTRTCTAHCSPLDAWCFSRINTQSLFDKNTLWFMAIIGSTVLTSTTLMLSGIFDLTRSTRPLSV